MTRTLRQHHRRAVGILAVSLPVLLGAALAGRRPLAEPSISTDHSGSLVWRRTGLWPGKIITELWRGSDGRLTLGVRAEEIVVADLLLYWAPGGSEATSVVPDRARFLGTVPGVAAIDPEISRSAGALVLYSLANHEWVATSRKFVLEKGE